MGKQWKQWLTLFWGAPKSLQMVTAAMRRKVMTNLDSILKTRDITVPTKVYLVKAMVLPVVMYGCESLTRKKAECQRINAFEMWCWRILLRVPWTARISCQSILNIHWKNWCWNSNTLATWCKKLTYLKRPWCWERWRWEEKGMTEDEMADSMDMSVSKLQELVIDREAMECYSSWGCR